jgi:hypothetical protein
MRIASQNETFAAKLLFSAIIKGMRALFFTAVLLFSFQTWAGYDFSPHSPAQASKEASRWSLAQWMEQKGRIQWMDLWLQSNQASPSYYEVYLGGKHGLYDRGTVTSGFATPDDSFQTTGGHLGFFVTWFGIFGQYEKSIDESRVTWDALAQLRLLGSSDQGSNFTVFYGLRDQEFLNEKVLNQQFGGSLTLYLLNPWAIQARYQNLLAKDSDLGNSFDGYRFEATSWLEWGAFRLFGTWFHEPTLITSPAGALTTIRREGYEVGLRVYLDFKK